MKNFITAVCIFFLCLFPYEGAFGAAAADESSSAPAKRQITPATSTPCAYEAAHHAYKELMSSPLDLWTKTLIRSSYKTNILDHGCLCLPEGDWPLRRSNKRTNHIFLREACNSFATLFEWDPGVLTITPSAPDTEPAGHIYFKFAPEYMPHKPQTDAEIAYVARLKEDLGDAPQGPDLTKPLGKAITSGGDCKTS